MHDGHREGNLKLHRTSRQFFGRSNGVIAAMEHLHAAVEPVQL
jgi:hypothetical protein